MLDVTLNRQTSQALYRQIAEQIKTQIGNGRLPANTRLPTVRQLAQELGVTRLTIQNAYGELQADGWIEATVGRGTFVSPAVQPMSLQPTIGQFLTPDSALSDMLEISQIIGVRSMAMAHPDPTLYPADEFCDYLNRLRPAAAQLLSYGPIQGDAELRVEVAKLVEEAGITAVPEQILITAGAMQGISLVTQALTQPGDLVLVDQPTFLGTLNIIKAQYLRSQPIPLLTDGPDLAVLERVMHEQRPRFFYTIPNFHNPTGYLTSPEIRADMLSLAARYDCFIVEDNIYGNLAYDGPPPPPLKAQDTDGRVIYISGFTKDVMPGMRIGYVIVPPHLRTRLLTLRRSTDMCSPELTQRALAHFLRNGGLKRHLRRVLPVYKERRDTLMASLTAFMPASVTWSQPGGGFSCWVRLPRYFAPGELYRLALQNGFAFTPGEAYLMDEPDAEFLRLCFGNQSAAGIRAGVQLLSELINQRVRAGSRPSTWLPIV